MMTSLSTLIDSHANKRQMFTLTIKEQTREMEKGFGQITQARSRFNEEVSIVRTDPTDPFISHFRIRLEILLLLVLLHVNKSQGFEYLAEGIIGTKGYSVNQNTPTESKTANFTVKVKDNLWNIRVKEEGSPYDYWECGTDGTNIYTLISLERYQKEMESQGKKHGTNVGSGFVDKGPVPHIYRCPYISVLWLAFASSSYFATTTNDLAEPILFYVLQDRELHRIGYQQRYAINKFNLPPYLPQELIYYADGKRLYWKDNKLSHYAPPLEGVRNAPFEKGFVNSRYQAKEGANLENHLLPSEFKFTVYHPRPAAKSSDDLFVLRSFDAVVTNVSSRVEKQDFLPTIRGMITVADERFNRETNSALRMEYLATNRWYSDEEQIASVAYKKEVRLDKYRKQVSARLQSHPNNQRYVLYAILAIGIGFPILFLRHFLKGGGGASKK